MTTNHHLILLKDSLATWPFEQNTVLEPGPWWFSACSKNSPVALSMQEREHFLNGRYGATFCEGEVQGAIIVAS